MNKPVYLDVSVSEMSVKQQCMSADIITSNRNMEKKENYASLIQIALQPA